MSSQLITLSSIFVTSQIWKMEFVNPVITSVVESLLVPIKKHLGFLVSSAKYVKDMNEKIVQLNLSEQDIQKNLDEAVEKNYKVSQHVSPWLGKVKNLKEKAQSISTGEIGCFNVTKRYKAGKQSYNILEEIQALKTWESEIEFTKEQRPLSEAISTTAGPSTSAPIHHGTQNNFESRDKVYKAALEALQSSDESHKMIALCGMGGVGKTTMMEQLRRDVQARNMFDEVVKVVVGENTDTFALQRAISIYIDQKDLKEETIDTRAERLRIIFEEKSKHGKKTLVIMDDLWNEVDLQDVGLSPLPSGFKMLFTLRDKGYCTRMGVRRNSIFEVGFLKDSEAENLFFGIVGLSDDDGPALQKIGENVVKKCGGLPIAIVTIAKFLNNNIKQAWEKALWRLEKDDLKDLDSITNRIFYMSYENLKGDDDKSIFLLCGLFPDDFDIPTEDLLRFGLGLGNFLKDGKTLGEARINMEICVNNLLNANLLIKSDLTGCVKMHDLVRAFVLSKISEVKQASVVNIDKTSGHDAKETYERILVKCTGMTKFPAEYLNYSNLSLLMLMDGHELLKFPEDIYVRMRKLKVVSYENMYIPLLPRTSEHSTKLRTLCLRSCTLVLDDVSFIGSLSNLEILSFVDCGIRWLPSTIGKLEKLKLLDLTGCVDLHIDDEVFQNLRCLEELYMGTFDDSHPINFTYTNCVELKNLSQRLTALELEFYKNKAQPEIMSFNNLKRFRISIGCPLVRRPMDDEQYSFRNTIKLSGECHELTECKINVLFEKTEELYLEVNGMNNLEDFSIMGHSFSRLRVLEVCKCEGLAYLLTVEVANGLKELERLKISECHVMRTLVAENSRVGVIRFQKLVFLSLRDLPNMVGLWDNVIELPKMEELQLDKLPKFKGIYPENTPQVQSILLNKKVVISKLKKLSIYSMENLKQIWPCEMSDTEKNNVSMLKRIEVCNCNNLMNIFPSNPLPLVSNLEELVVYGCGSIEVLFKLDLESVGEHYSSSSALRRIRVDDAKKLKEVWRMKGVNNNSNIHINCFKGVQSIWISSCSSFTNVFTPATTNFDLGALTKYNTWHIGKEIKGEISEVDENSSPTVVTYPSTLLHTCHHLQHLTLWNDQRVGEVVFDMDNSSSSRQLSSIQPPLLLPHLQTMRLQDLKKTSHVWKCNWNKFLIRQSQPLRFPFQNLTGITLLSCHNIEYLFSPLIAKYLSKLRNVTIALCNGIEKVISSRDDDNSTSTSSNQNTNPFLCLDTLMLNRLPQLTSVDDGSKWGKVSYNACWSLCQYTREIRVYGCDALSSLIPWYATGQMKRLQELEIKNCCEMIEVFESELMKSNPNNVDEGSAHDDSGSGLKNTAIVGVPQLFNLKTVCISNCDLLPHIFTFSTLKTLHHLKKLKVERCKAMRVIVKEENGTSLQCVVFPHLEELELDDLPNLTGFSLAKNDFRWPSLDKVVMSDCPQLIMFTSGQSTTPKLKYIHTRFGKYTLECGLNLHGPVNQTIFPNSSLEPTISKGMHWSCHNLIEINISRRDVGTVIVPSDALEKLEKLQQITISKCYRLKEVFALVELEGSNEVQNVVQIPNLAQVNLEDLDDLECLWKSNQRTVLEFPNLTTLSIRRCVDLEHVFTCSMVGSLVQLQDLHIHDCEKIEVIVQKEEEECDSKVNQIMLPCLKSLKLYNLRNLKRFCVGNDAFLLPALYTLDINDCPAITVFTMGHVSTPELKVIHTKFGRWNVKPDLNSFIKTKKGEGYNF